MTWQSSLSLSRIAEAARVVDPVFRDTPQFMSESLSAKLGLRLLAKIECLNPIRSFKGRGADYLLHGVGPGSDTLVAASAGNFGQGLAYAARARGIRVIVFAAATARPLKVAQMRALGADVRLVGADFDAAKAAAREFARAPGFRFVEDGREPAIAEGAGTIGVELARWSEPIDTVLIPIGNGALAAGVGRWLKTHAPATRIVGVVAERAPAMLLSWRERRCIATDRADTMADGIAVREPVPEALDELAAVLDDCLSVDESRLVEAMRVVFDHLGLVVEPAGAAGVAAALSHAQQLRGKLVATILCGGNVEREEFIGWIGRGAR